MDGLRIGVRDTESRSSLNPSLGGTCGPLVMLGLASHAELHLIKLLPLRNPLALLDFPQSESTRPLEV